MFDNPDLSVVRWQHVPIIGDEVRARDRKDDKRKRKTRQQRVEDYQAAAYRRLGVALQTNGMNDEAHVPEKDLRDHLRGNWTKLMVIWQRFARDGAWLAAVGCNKVVGLGTCA